MPSSEAQPLQSSGDLVAVHAGQADVQQDDVRRESACHLERRRAVVGHPHLVARLPEQRARLRRSPRCRPPPGCGGASAGRSAIVAGGVTGFGRPGLGTAGAAAGRRTRCPGPGPSLWASTVPPCISTSRFDQGQPDAQPALRAVERPLRLGEQVEDAGAASPAAMPIAVVPHAERPRSPSSRRPTGRCAALRSVYLAALFSRFATTCASRVGSASSRTGSSGSDDRQARGRGRRSAGGSSRRRRRRPWRPSSGAFVQRRSCPG